MAGVSHKHKPWFFERRKYDPTPDPRITVGWCREDEDGWREVIGVDHDDDEPGFWVQDRDGAEDFIPRDEMGHNWGPPL